MILLPLDEI